MEENSPSKFKNIYGKEWKKSDCYSNLQVSGTSGCLLKCSGTQFAFLKDDLSLQVVPFGHKGKLQPSYPLLRGHTQAILTFDFNPFDDCIVSTGSRDKSIKIWRVSAETNEQTEVRTLLKHENRVTLLLFHPQAANGTAVIGTNLQFSPRIPLIPQFDYGTLKKDQMQYGTTIASSTKEKIRLYDPRAKTTAVKEFTAYTGAKPFKVSWVGDNVLFTNGFIKEERQFALWDIRQISDKSAPLTSRIIDASSTSLIPFYDQSAGLMYLAGKGNLLYCYEITEESPYATPISKYTATNTTTDMALVPKRVYDVTQCEVARFLASTKNTVDVISFYVPRKAQNLFHEDLYVNVPAGKASLSCAEWLSGKNKDTTVVQSMQPPGLLSVYDVPEEDGGRSRLKDNQRGASPSSVKSGPLPQVNTGRYLLLEIVGIIWNSWYRRYVIAQEDGLYCFDNEQSANVLESVQYDNISAIVPSTVDNLAFTIHAPPQVFTFQCQNQEDRDNWILFISDQKTNFINRMIKQYDASDLKKSGEQPEERKEDEFTGGNLLILEQGYVFSSWVNASLKIDGRTLHITIPSLLSSTEYHIQMDRITAVAPTTAFPDVSGVFQIATPDMIYSLRAQSEQERQTWINKVADTAEQFKQSKGDASISVTQVLQGYAEVKAGLLSFWSRQFICLYGVHLCYLRSHEVSVPTKRIFIGEVVSVEVSDRDPALAFQLKMKDGTILHHRLQDTKDRDKWLQALNKARLGSINLLPLMESTSSITELTGTVTEIDWSDVKVGKQKLLYCYACNFTHSLVLKSLEEGVCEFNLYQLHTHRLHLMAYSFLTLWNGSKSSRVTKARGLDISNRIRLKERGGKCTVHVLEEGKEFMEEFWKELGGKARVQDTKEQESIDAPVDVSLYRVDDSGIYIIHDGGICSKDKLESRYCFVVESDSEIYMWQGKECSKGAVANALKWIKSLLNQKKRSWVATAKIVENAETVLFKEKFLGYPGFLPISTTRVEIKGNITESRKQEKIDVSQLRVPIVVKEEQLHDGKGKVQIWRVKDFEKELFTEELLGHFFSGECFLIWFRYMMGNTEQHIIYFWQGRDSSINERGASALLTKEVNELSAAGARQIRVVQNMEPQHFLLLFKGKFVVHQGKYEDTEVPNKVTMFDIRGTNEINTKAIEVKVTAERLHSSHVTLLLCPKIDRSEVHIIAWIGKQANSFEKQTSASLQQQFVTLYERKNFKCRFDTIIFQGSETADFWQLLGGGSHPVTVTARIQPRVFLCSNSTGTVQITEQPAYQLYQDMLDYNRILPTSSLRLQCKTL